MGSNGQHVGYVFLGLAILFLCIGVALDIWENKLIAKEERRIARRDRLREQMLEDDLHSGHRTLYLVPDQEAEDG